MSASGRWSTTRRKSHPRRHGRRSCCSRAAARSPRSGDHGHLAAIIAACRRLARVDLATLNHDLLLEAALTASGIDYADGFQSSAEDVRFWTDDWGDTRVRLLKLHGSIDCFDFRSRDDPSRDWRAARYLGFDVEHAGGTGMELRSPRPTFLTGTFTKILAYQTGHYPDVHARSTRLCARRRGWW